MSGFSPEWLTLREPVDHRSRDGTVAEALRRRFESLTAVRVVDVGCGTGSNLRGTVHLLPDHQTWTLVDYDDRLLAAARTTLGAWGDTCESARDGLVLRKHGKTLRVALRRADLNADLDSGLGEGADLVTASAFFDLCSAAFIERFVAAVAQRGAVFFTVLTYNGVQTWTPPHPADAAMLAAFCAHQAGDKGFGPAAGPVAPPALRTAFTKAGYQVREGDSPWMLGEADQALVNDLARGFAGAVAETGRLDAATVTSWAAAARTRAIVGHTDTLALPARA